ncbi:MAG: hypothetical protein AAGE52_02595 [Myxococcota bacterium]
MAALFVTCSSCGREVSFGPKARGQQGSCACGATLLLEPDGAAARRRGVARWEEVERAKHHDKAIKALEKELSKKPGLELMAVRTLRLDDPVSSDEERAAQKAAKDYKPVNLRVDTLQCIQLMRGNEWVYLLIPYYGAHRMAHEFMSIIQGTLVAPLYFDRDGPRKHVFGQWVGDDVLTQAARANKELIRGIEWQAYLGRIHQNLLWGLQVVPFQGRTLHLMQTAVRGVLSTKFAPHWYLERRDALIGFGGAYATTTPPPAQLRHQPLARLFVDELHRKQS